MDKYKEIRDLKTRRKRRGGKNRQSLEEPLLSAGRAEEGETPSRLESEQSPDAPAISPFANPPIRSGRALWGAARERISDVSSQRVALANDLQPSDSADPGRINSILEKFMFSLAPSLSVDKPLHEMLQGDNLENGRAAMEPEAAPGK